MRTWSYLTTGNGHGFQIYDADQNKIVRYLDHPYRYLRPGPDPKGEGIARRNLVYDLYFGVRAPGGTGWLNTATRAADPDYVDQDNIIHAPLTMGGVTTDSYFFSPFGYEGNAVIALLKAPGASDAFLLLNFHMGAGQGDTPDANGESTRLSAAQQAIVETGPTPDRGAMVYVALSGYLHADCNNVYNKVLMNQDLADSPGCSGNDVVPGFQAKPDANGWVAMAVLYVDDPSTADTAAQQIRAWANGRSPDKILADARAEWDAWRKPPPAAVNLSPDELRVWRQGEAVLRMGQVREPNVPGRNNHGMILASLPIGEWHTGWVRDAEYAIVALARTGHFAEAKAALTFLLNTGPVGKYKDYVGGADYRISLVRYFGTGEEECDYNNDGYNIEIDGWGMVLWAARQYIDASGDVAWLNEHVGSGATVYDTLVQGIAGPLAQNLESNGIVKADTSIWEVHWNLRRHYAFTSLAAYRGFCDMSTMALRASQMNDVKKYQDLALKVGQGFLGSFLDPQGAIAGTIELLQSTSQYADAAVVEAFDWDFLPDFKGRTATATLNLLNRLRVSSGGFKRIEGSNQPYDANEWILIDLRMSDAFRRAGQTGQADALVNLIVGNAAPNFYLLPELYNAVDNSMIGAYTGSIPMVGYGGGAFILTMLDRAGLYEPSDCGASVLRPDGGGVVATDGGVRVGAGGPVGSLIPRTTACICQAGGAAAPLPAGTAALIGLPWVLLLLRLGRSRRRR